MLGSEGSDRGADQISVASIAAAEALHGVEFPDAARAVLAEGLPAQLAHIRAVRGLQRPFDLQPALTFNPCLPGQFFERQEDQLRLSRQAASKLPQLDEDIAFSSARSIGEWIRDGLLKSARVTEIYLARIARLNDKLFCFTTVTAELARTEAAAADLEIAAGKWRGPLHGVPYAIKDVFDTAGVPTTWGAEIYRDRTPKIDAAVVTMLREAGAILLGKAATAELANGFEWFGGACRNPWNCDEPAGGSSSGSASAVAAGLCAFALGTDSLGSILNPSDRCGVTGLRATFGRVPVKGGMPLTPSLERIGPICRQVEDAALVLAAINGPDATSATSIDVGFAYDADAALSQLRVGYCPEWFKSVRFEPGATRPVSEGHLVALKTLQEICPNTFEIELPDLPYGSLGLLLYAEAAAVFEELQLSGSDTKLLNQRFYGWPNNWRAARMLSAVDYIQLDRFRRQVMIMMDEVFAEVDMLFAPTYGSFDLLMITNFTGHPGLTFRSGLEESSTRSSFIAPVNPAGPRSLVTNNVSLHGRLFQEGQMLAVARALEERLGVWRARPLVG